MHLPLVDTASSTLDTASSMLEENVASLGETGPELSVAGLFRGLAHSPLKPLYLRDLLTSPVTCQLAGRKPAPRK